MKTSRLALLTATLLTVCFYFSCQKMDTPAGPEPGPGHITEYTQANISGRITDDQKLPVSGAVVRIGVSNTTTDVNGMFSFNNIQVDKTAGLVKVEKEGFFKGIKTLVVTSGKDNQVAIQLIKKVVAGTFNGSSGGTITLPSAGGSIIFEPNSILNTANFAGYTGPVSVSAFFINPAADNFFDIMPGTLRGIDANNNETGLQSFGMMAVELTGTNGEKLQLIGGKKAVLHFPIPASLQGQAPATIPLWSLNDTTGLWEEEGTATKQGTEYVGSVSHFSYWNCDAPFPVIDFTATIKTQQGTGLANARVVISGAGADSSLSGFGYTNNDGVAGGKIPSNRSLTLKVYDKCGTLLHTKNVGPFNAAANLGVITVTSTAMEVTISGTVINCSAAPVTNGFVTINMEGIHYRSNLVNGAFSLTAIRCSNETTTATVTPYDITGNREGPTKTLTIAGTTAAAGQLAACATTLAQFINFTIDGTSFAFTPPADSLEAGRHLRLPLTMVVAYRKDGSTNRMQFDFRGEKVTGPGPMDYMTIELGDKGYVNSGTDTVHITEFGAQVGGFVAGSYNGTVKDTTANRTLPFQMNFRVKRWNW